MAQDLVVQVSAADLAVMALNDAENAIQRMMRALRRGDRKALVMHARTAKAALKEANPHMQAFAHGNRCDG